jgi:peroxiredoxin
MLNRHHPARRRDRAGRPAGAPGGRLAALGAGLAFAWAASTLAPTAQAALPVGATAPAFSAEAALAGRPFRFTLAEALARGPVVLYFYPKAFTSGCTIEAHEFAEAMPQFEALGASVVGLSNDDIATLRQFSVEACRNRFAVAADAGAVVMKRYDAAFGQSSTADRISYVIEPGGRIVHVVHSPDPYAHVKGTLEAVKRWKASAAPGR